MVITLSTAKLWNLEALSYLSRVTLEVQGMIRLLKHHPDYLDQRAQSINTRKGQTLNGNVYIKPGVKHQERRLHYNKAQLFGFIAFKKHFGCDLKWPNEESQGSVLSKGLEFCSLISLNPRSLFLSAQGGQTVHAGSRS